MPLPRVPDYVFDPAYRAYRREFHRTGDAVDAVHAVLEAVADPDLQPLNPHWMFLAFVTGFMAGLGFALVAIGSTWGWFFFALVVPCIALLIYRHLHRRRLMRRETD